MRPRPKARKVPAKTNEPGSGGAASRLPSAGDWQARTLAVVRQLIKEADPEVVEETKWVKPSNPAGVPVWSHDGILCTGETYKDKVKLTFMRGAALQDAGGLFNAGFGGGMRRAIDLLEGDTLDPAAFEALVREAVALNTGKMAR